MIGTHKLTEDRVDVIKLLLSNGEHTQAEIAELCNNIWGIKVSRVLINHIKTGRRWNDDIRSFEMRDGRPKRSNDFRDFGPPTQRVWTDKDMEMIQEMLDNHIKNDK